jgi:hypothetical protein
MFRLLALACLAAAAAQADYRVLVSTDLGGDPDDIQSLYRLVHYSDILRVEGIVSSPGPGALNSAGKIRDWIRRIDVENMRANGHPELMPERDLLDRIRQGAFRPGAPAKGRSTEGSRWIIQRAHAADPRPLWVLVWGAITDVAQALYDDPSIAPRIRIYSIGSLNYATDVAARDFIFAGLESKWRDLWWIESGVPKGQHETFRGVFVGGDQSGEWHNVEFVKRNIRGHGGTHDGEFDRVSGDAFPLASWGKDHGAVLKEGDSPSMLYLLGPGKPDDPTAESWGGQFRHFDRARFPNYFVDLDVAQQDNWATVSKHRVAFLTDWKKRWSWYSRPAVPRLSVSPDGHGLVSADGKPFIWIGDTAWNLFVNLDRDQAERYLLDRKDKKFTVIQVSLLGFGEPNIHGDKPFPEGHAFEQLNEPWFRNADAIIGRAETLGLYVLLMPAWAASFSEGKSPTLTSASTAQRYGKLVGERFRQRTNVLWALGGDARPGHPELYDALARGIEEGLGYKPLMTYHPPGGTNRPPATSSGEFFHDRAWLDFNMIQSGHRRGNENYLRIAEDYQRKPPKPTLDGEPCYEAHPIQHRYELGAFESYDVRQRAYWSVLAGAFGFTYGGNGIWQMSTPERPGQLTHFSHYWDAALDHEGARQLKYLHAFLSRYPERVPDQSILVTDPGTGADRLQAARTPDGGTWMIYDTIGRDLEVRLPAQQGRAWWCNPRTGDLTSTDWKPGFHPPGQAAPGNDWLLILEPERK